MRQEYVDTVSDSKMVFSFEGYPRVATV